MNKRRTYVKYSPEYLLHCSIVDYLSHILTSKSLLTTFPSGGGGKIRGARLKRAGLKAGIPDLMIIHNGLYYGLEIKTKSGKLSENQKNMHELIKKCGGKVAVVRSISDTEKVINEWQLRT